MLLHIAEITTQGITLRNSISLLSALWPESMLVP